MAIPTVEEAANILQGILGRITSEISDSERSDIADELVSFTDPASAFQVPDSPQYAELIETALSVAKELNRALTAAAIGRIQERSEALARYVTAISAVTNEAEQNAKDLKLQILDKTLLSTQRMIDLAKEARKAFKEDRSKEGFAAIENVIDEIENLRNSIAV